MKNIVSVFCDTFVFDVQNYCKNMKGANILPICVVSREKILLFRLFLVFLQMINRNFIMAKVRNLSATIIKQLIWIIHK